VGKRAGKERLREGNDQSERISDLLVPTDSIGYGSPEIAIVVVPVDKIADFQQPRYAHPGSQKVFKRVHHLEREHVFGGE